MPRTKSSANSASKNKVATKANIGNTTKSTDALNILKEQYNIDQEKQVQRYAKASDDKLLRTIRDLTRGNSNTGSISKTTKETIRGYLTGNIYSNSTNLINASKYLYFRSPIYAKMCNIYANMYCLECRMVSPNFTFQKGLDNKALKQYDDTLDLLDIMNLRQNAATPLLNMWICDVSFNLFIHDDIGCFFYPIDPSEAIIDGYYEVDHGWCYSMALDMSKWRSTQRQLIIEALQEPLISMYREYESTGARYIHCPAEYSLVLKQRYEDPNNIIPPLLPYLNQFANLNDLIDSQADADSLSYYRMIYMPLKVLKNSNHGSDDFEVSPDLAIQYFKILTDSAIPPGVSSGVVPGDELKTIDFSDSVTEDVNRVENSQQQILGGAGGVGALLNATKAINNTELIKNTLKAESAYVLTGVLGQIEAWTNLQLKINLSNYCNVSYLPVTIFTKEDYRKSLLESLQCAYQYRLAYGTLLGYTERQTMAQIHFETEVLRMQDYMKYPLQSSYTTSNTSNGDIGAPEKDPGELSPSGERSRNS